MTEKPKPDRSRKVPRGRYRHFKGTEYKAIGTALHSETLEPLVIYHEPFAPQDLWARPFDSFEGRATDDSAQPRFLFLGEHYTPEEERERQLLAFVEWVVGMADTEGGAYMRLRTEVCVRFPQYRDHVNALVAQRQAVADQTYAAREAVLNLPGRELDLCIRALKCMNRLGLRTIGELTRRTADELLEVKGFGETSLQDVRAKLAKRGLKLRGD